MPTRQLFALCLLLACCSLAMPATAATTYNYRIYALGIPIGKASIAVTRNGGDYDLNFNGKFFGVFPVFSGAKGDMHMHGAFDALHGARAATVDANVQWDQRLRHTTTTLQDGRVVTTETTPPYTYEPEKRIPLDRNDLHDVLDPMSAMLRPLQNGKLDCTARLRIFDGRERYDLAFSPTKDPWTCHVQPIPVSGYDYRHKSPANPPESLDITFMPSADSGESLDMAVPARFVRPMLIGTVEVARVELRPQTAK